MSQARRRVRTVVTWVVAAVIVGLGGFVAGRWTFTPPPAATPESGAATLTVTNATVAERLDVTISVTWNENSSGVNPADGTVTTVPVRDQPLVHEGDVLYSVDLRPVVAATGTVPSFRGLAQGASGADVVQLQRFLARGGFYTGAEDGAFGHGTESAVKAWQRSLGVEPSGVVNAGDILFVNELPAEVVASDDLYVGARVVAGQRLLSVIDPEPVFTARLSADDVARVPSTSADVEIVGPSSIWPATTGTFHVDDDGTTSLELLPASGSTICADECGLLSPAGGPQVLTGSIVITPDVTGPAVPLSAIGTDASGRAFVVGPSGSRIPVTVLGSDGSRAVLSGIAEGDTIQLFATAQRDVDPAEDAERITPSASVGGTG